MTTKNPAIGTCPCPVNGCSASCEVRKFRPRHQRDTGRRVAGKLYVVCPTHGRLGMDPTDGMQEWILEHAKLDGPPPHQPPTPTPAPAPAARPAQPAQSSPPLKKDDGGWGFMS